MSMNLGIISMVSLIIVVYLTYRQKGEATVGYGVTGLLATLFSLAGLVLGVLTIQKKEYFKLFSVLGIALNLAALGGIAFLLYIGL